MASIKDFIVEKITQVLGDLGVEGISVNVQVPQNPGNGDYSTNIAMFVKSKISAKGGSASGRKIQISELKTPMELAEEIVKILNTKYLIQNTFSRVEAVKPGFINFWLSDDALINSLIQKSRLPAGRDKKQETSDKPFNGKKIFVEFAQPNTHKEFHIGHLRNIAIGEALSKIIEHEDGKVFRGNYQGDIGSHVAKAIYGLAKIFNFQFSIFNLETKSLGERIKALAEAYAAGNKAYEEDEEARKEIQEINISLYKKEENYRQVWETTRAWSLEYFETIYKKLGVKFDKLFFESQTFEKGKEIVLEHLGKVFKKDQGAVIFQGENYGLHNRVFLTTEGYATYEGKEMALAFLEYETFPFDLALHIVAQEQEGYFKVVFKALELIDDKFKNAEKHLSYGMVELKEGKMSSRQGNIITALWLLDEAKKRIKEQFPSVEEQVAEKIAVGAVKYSLLKFSRTSNIAFSFEDSININGNSGPYLQYTYARTQSVERKSEARNPKHETNSNDKNPNTSNVSDFENSDLDIVSNFDIRISNLNEEERILLRHLIHFEEIVRDAAENFAPNILCNYLFDLAQKFNLFYQKCPILKSEKQEFRLSLTSKTGEIIKVGLQLLGIESPKKI